MLLDASPVPALKIPASPKKSHSNAAAVWCHSRAPAIFNVICWSITTTSHTNAKSVTVNSRGLETFRSTCCRTWGAIPERLGLCPFQPCSRSWHVNKLRSFSSKMGTSISVACVQRILLGSAAWKRTFACIQERGLTSVKSARLLLLRHVLSRCTCAYILARNHTSAGNVGALSPEGMRCIPICTFIKVSLLMPSTLFSVGRIYKFSFFLFTWYHEFFFLFLLFCSKPKRRGKET